jgi:hypothetical protein
VSAVRFTAISRPRLAGPTVDGLVTEGLVTLEAVRIIKYAATNAG